VLLGKGAFWVSLGGKGRISSRAQDFVGIIMKVVMNVRFVLFFFFFFLFFLFCEGRVVAVFSGRLLGFFFYDLHFASFTYCANSASVLYEYTYIVCSVCVFFFFLLVRFLTVYEIPWFLFLFLFFLRCVFVLTWYDDDGSCMFFLFFFVPFSTACHGMGVGEINR
jgi:hypothetical protein